MLGRLWYLILNSLEEQHMDRMTAMETFVTVVDAGSFSAAARRVKLGQPAVSKAIAKLEEHLGARLLLRSTRGLTPTDAGQRFYEHGSCRAG
jgi:DNA-binding transcriptional LysR family regulator